MADLIDLLDLVSGLLLLSYFICPDFIDAYVAEFVYVSAELIFTIRLSYTIPMHL